MVALYVSRKIFKSNLNRNEYQVSLTFLILSALPAIFIGTVVGGSLGGAYGEHITQTIGLGSIGVPIGITIGLTVTISLILVLGASLGYLTARLFYKVHGKTN